ncbi:MAG: phosphodiester glycosidase family protein [Clostridiales bacterium]|jgi:exopolysaccharide biosynthesis protein|nr:phosphodiester glycosidase family protein [Clostridiales bacterium]
MEEEKAIVSAPEEDGALGNQRPNRKKGEAVNLVLRVTGRFLLVMITIVVAVAATLYITLYLICRGPSVAARELFVTTFLETGQMKFVASMFLTREEIDEIIRRNSMPVIEQEVDPSLIVVAADEPEEDSFDIDGIELIEISGRTFFAKMLIVNDPSRVKLATTYPWSEYGMELAELVEKSGAVAGVNGGLYQSDSNKGGRPIGLAVSQGEIQYNSPEGWAGLYLIGFDYKNILRIIDIEGMSAAELKTLIEEEGIRDAVAFQEEYSDANNHFVQLIINGEARMARNLGSGANPRTAIGQRADGAVLLLVTDGRGASGHLGATAADLISIMTEYGAVNAANLDGGSSSCMYYNGQYEMTSVTLYYANSSWRLPTGFVVESR